MSKPYSSDLQKLFLEIMLHDAQVFARIQGIFNPSNFDEDLNEAASFIIGQVKGHSVLPTVGQIKAKTGLTLNKLDSLSEGHANWFLEEFEQFTRRKELERAILKSVDLLEKENFDPVEKLIVDAVQIGLPKNLGTNYFENPKERLLRLKNNNGQLSTGWPTLDKKLYGGFNRGELQIFAGSSGAGKSLFLQNLSLNWVTAGLNGLYITLELNEDLCAMRLDSMVAGIATRDIFRDLDTVVMKVNLVGRKAGDLVITYLPAQSTVNNIRSIVKELEIKNSEKIDFLAVDYLDLLMPVSAKVSPNDLFVKDKYVSEELRNLSKELNVILVTASQLNRGAVEEVDYDHSHIAGGISKINTADNVIGIFTSRAMRERGRYQIQLMKTRSSSGVGQKIDLEFDIESLRIRDTLDQEHTAPISTQAVLGQIKNKSTVTPAENVPAQDGPKIKADVQSSKLKDMLNKLKTDA